MPSDFEYAQKMKSALHDDGVPKMYANAFSCALNGADATILFQLADKPVFVLNLSFTTAKTLAQKLQGIIDHLESMSGNKIMTTMEVGMFLGGKK